MNKEKGIAFLAIIIVIAVVAVLGGGVYVATKNRAEVKIDENMMNNNGGNIMNAGGRTSLRSLLGLGQNLTCTFSRASAEGNVSGTMYIAGAGSEMRGDFMMGTMGSHMIRQGEYMYAWTDGVSQGTKIKAEAEADNSQKKDAEAVNLDDEADYECNAWNVDNSKFDLPSDINFLDMSAMMQTNTQIQGNNQCSTCDAIPDAGAKAQCKAALGC